MNTHKNMNTQTYKDIDLKYDEVCQFCKRHQVDEGGACAWCAYDAFLGRCFEAELASDTPNFEGLDEIGEKYI